MTEYKLFTYDDPVDRLSFNSKTAIDLDNLTDDGKSLLQEWFAADYAKGFLAVDYAKAILEGVTKLNVQLGIGKRAIEIVKRWQEGHPWLPENISLTKTVDREDQIIPVSAVDAPPITQKSLHDGVINLNQLINWPPLTIELFTAKPAWRNPEYIENKILSIKNKNVRLDGRWAYRFEQVYTGDLKPFFDVLKDVLRVILPNLDKDDFSPETSCVGFCGAWYIVEVQTKETVFLDQNVPTNHLKILVPVGLIKPTEENDPTPILVPFDDEDKRDVYTLGLDFRFISFKNKVASAEFSSSVHWLKKVFLDREEFSIQKKFFRSLGWGKFQIPIDNLNLRDSAEWRKAKGDARIDQARKLAPEIVGKESLVVIATDGVHVLENDAQIGAWCAKYELLDKMIPPPRLELSQGDKILRFVPFATTDVGKWLDSPLPDEMQNTDQSYDSLSEDQKKKFSFPSVNDYTNNEYADADPSVFRLRLFNPPIDNDEVEVVLKVLTRNGDAIDKISKDPKCKGTATHTDGITLKLKRCEDHPYIWVSPYLRVATTNTGANKTSEYGVIHSLPPLGSDKIEQTCQFGRRLRVNMNFDDGNNLEQDFQIGGEPYARIPVKFFCVGNTLGALEERLARDKLANLNQYWAGQGLEFKLFDPTRPIERSETPSRTLISIGDFTGGEVVSKCDFDLNIWLQAMFDRTVQDVHILAHIPGNLHPEGVAGQIKNDVQRWMSKPGDKELRLDAKIYSIKTPRYYLTAASLNDPLKGIGERGPVDLDIRVDKVRSSFIVDKLEIKAISILADEIDRARIDIHVPPVDRPYHDAMFLPPAAVTRHWVRAFSSDKQEFVSIVIEKDAAYRNRGEGFPHKLCQEGLCGLYDAHEIEMKRRFADPLNTELIESDAPAQTLLNFGLWEESGAGFIMFTSWASSQKEVNDIQHEMGHVLADLNHTIASPGWFYQAELMHSGGPTPQSALQMTRHEIDVDTVDNTGGWKRKLKRLTSGYGGAIRQRIQEIKPGWLTGSKQWTT